MRQGFTERGLPFEDRRMWRKLLARLHPDAGGEQELFLLACALKDRACEDPRLRASRAAHDSSNATRFLGSWKGAMGSWASRNRSALQQHRARHRSKRDQ